MSQSKNNQDKDFLKNHFFIVRPTSDTKEPVDPIREKELQKAKEQLEEIIGFDNKEKKDI